MKNSTQNAPNLTILSSKITKKNLGRGQTPPKLGMRHLVPNPNPNTPHPPRRLDPRGSCLWCLAPHFFFYISITDYQYTDHVTLASSNTEIRPFESPVVSTFLEVEV